MARIYISSTYRDLVEYREAVYRTLRRMGHNAIAMEDYVATDKRPLDKCLDDVASCDVYVGIFAWRYGYIPEEDNPAHKSITELEFRHAVNFGIKCLIFLMDEEHAWPRSKMAKGEEAEQIEALRAELGKDFTASFFKSPENLESLVSAAISNWEKEEQKENQYSAGSKKILFTDERVADVAKTIGDQIETNSSDIDIEKFILEINRLFSRKTFRYENLRECPEQRWADRLDSAYQTRNLLQSYEGALAYSLSHYSLFERLIREVDGYSMDMGSLLFESPVDYNLIKDHIGTPSFKNKLPPEIRFPINESKQPIIPDHINDPIEQHRLAAIECMDRLLESNKPSTKKADTQS